MVRKTSVLMIGAAMSLGFLFLAGRHNHSVVLMSLFTLWVISPFAGWLLVIHKRLIPATKSCYLAITVAAIPVMLYLAAYLYPGRTPAFIFLITPFASWMVLVLAAVLLRNKLK